MGADVSLFHLTGSLGRARVSLVYGAALGVIGVDGLLIAVGVLVAPRSLASVISATLLARRSPTAEPVARDERQRR